MHPSGICAPNPTQPNQHPLPLLDPTHHPSLWKLNPAGTNNHNKLRQQKALCSFSVPHTHTTHTSHTHTHTLTHPHSLTHPVCSLSHLPGPASAVVSVSVSCNSRPVVLSCPALPSPALPRPALPATRSTRARCQPAPVAARPPTGHRTVPYRTPPPGTPGTPHDTTRNYSKLLPTTTSLTLSLCSHRPLARDRPPTTRTSCLTLRHCHVRRPLYPRASRFLHRPTLRSLTPPLQPMCWATSR